MLKITVMSKEQAEAYSRQRLDHKVAIISINSFDAPKAELSFNEYIVDVLYLTFDDYDFDSKTSMKPSDAYEIVEFLKNNIGFVDELVVHCLMGISRSAGVAAAISKHLYDDCTEIFESSKMDANMHCFDITYNALNKLLNK